MHHASLDALNLLTAAGNPAGNALNHLGLLDPLANSLTPPATPVPPIQVAEPAGMPNPIPLMTPAGLGPQSGPSGLHTSKMLMQPQEPVHAESSYGFLSELHDALLVVQLCLDDKLPLVRRRLTQQEREAIRSGSIFAFIESSTPLHGLDEDASDPSAKFGKDWQPMRRWTDGLAWSKSRVQGHFLVYKEVAEKRAITAKRPGGSDDVDDYSPARSTSGRKRARVGRLSSVVKQDGLMKKTFSIIVDEHVWHVINYYVDEDVERNLLPTPSSQFPNVQISQKLLDPTKLRLRSAGPAKESSTVAAASGSGYRLPTPRSRSTRSTRSRRAKSFKEEDYDDDDDEYRPPGSLHFHAPTPSGGMSATGELSRMMGMDIMSGEGGLSIPQSPGGSGSINTNGGFITLRQLEPESATVQVPLPPTLKDLKRIATKTFRLSSPDMTFHGPHGELIDAKFPLLMDGDHIDVDVHRRRVPTPVDFPPPINTKVAANPYAPADSTAEAALALTRLASAE